MAMIKRGTSITSSEVTLGWEAIKGQSIEANAKEVTEPSSVEEEEEEEEK